MRPQQQRGSWRERPLVVLHVHLVRRSDFHERRAAALEDVGQPEASADLDELAARDHDFATLRERIENEENRGRAVIDRQRVLRAREFAQRAGHASVTRTAFARFQIVFEIRIAGADVRDGGQRLGGQRRASQFVWTMTPVALIARIKVARR